jgi:hypothetical protein
MQHMDLMNKIGICKALLCELSVLRFNKSDPLLDSGRAESAPAGNKALKGFRKKKPEGEVRSE